MYGLKFLSIFFVQDIQLQKMKDIESKTESIKSQVIQILYSTFLSLSKDLYLNTRTLTFNISRTNATHCKHTSHKHLKKLQSFLWLISIDIDIIFILKNLFTFYSKSKISKRIHRKIVTQMWIIVLCTLLITFAFINISSKYS